MTFLHWDRLRSSPTAHHSINSLSGPTTGEMGCQATIVAAIMGAAEAREGGPLMEEVVEIHVAEARTTIGEDVEEITMDLEAVRTGVWMTREPRVVSSITEKANLVSAYRSSLLKI